MQISTGVKMRSAYVDFPQLYGTDWVNSNECRKRRAIGVLGQAVFCVLCSALCRRDGQSRDLTECRNIENSIEIR